MQDNLFAAYIGRNPGITPIEVANHLGVSVRTVRTYTKQTNAAMEGFARIDLTRGEGFNLVVEDGKAFTAWARGPVEMRSDDLPQTPRERVEYIINDLIFRNDWITLDELAQILYVSRSAVSSDIKAVEKRLQPFELSIEKRPHYGIRLAGSEPARRACLVHIIMETFKRSPDESGAVIEARPSWDVGNLVDSVSDVVDGVLDEEPGFRINSLVYKNLIVHIAVAILRTREGCSTLFAPQELEAIMRSGEFAIARRIASRLESLMDVSLKDDEIAYISIHLSGKRVIDAIPGSTPSSTVITDEVWDVVSDMLDQVWSVFRFDFRGDLELRMNLARHIPPLIVRLCCNMTLENPMMHDIKARYPLAYAMARDASAVLGVQYHTKVSDDEIGYIALAFALALERHVGSIEKKRILVVCASGAGSSHLLEFQIRKQFGDYIESLHTCDVLQLPTFDFSSIDYVFTTVPLPIDPPVPVREIKYFLDDDAVRSVKRLLGSTERDGEMVLNYFSRDLFFTDVPGKTKDEVLSYLTSEVCACRNVSESFAELVRKREEVVSTAFGNDVAIPHPLEASGDETFVCVGLLRQPVEWDDAGQTVQAVFLSSFTDHDGVEVQKLYSVLASMLISRRAVARLLEDRSWETLAALIMTYASSQE